MMRVMGRQHSETDSGSKKPGIGGRICVDKVYGNMSCALYEYHKWKSKGF